jgi:alkanesulfonate monooxygenase SsuD/methylene tetrahydromethanopterin reductase-like flavin-dependent oxidoreductase (luciferase family)
VKFYYFHLMPYVIDHDERSSWVTLSNRHYDPAVGHTLYHEYLDQLEYAEKLGWDGICVNEHHQNCYGTMPSPNVMAAMLVRRTSRAKIAILGNGLPLRENPLRIAEEIAMLDVVSGGRVISGFVRGIGPEYFSLGVNPTRASASTRPRS